MKQAIFLTLVLAILIFSPYVQAASLTTADSSVLYAAGFQDPGPPGGGTKFLLINTNHTTSAEADVSYFDLDGRFLGRAKKTIVSNGTITWRPADDGVTFPYNPYGNQPTGIAQIRTQASVVGRYGTDTALSGLELMRVGN